MNRPASDRSGRAELTRFVECFGLDRGQHLYGSGLTFAEAPTLESLNSLRRELDAIRDQVDYVVVKVDAIEEVLAEDDSP